MLESRYFANFMKIDIALVQSHMNLALTINVNGDFFNWPPPEFAKCWPVSRLGICQKIYTTQFSGEKILHTENA